MLREILDDAPKSRTHNIIMRYQRTAIAVFSLFTYNSLLITLYLLFTIVFTINYPLSTLHYPPSTINYPLSPLSYTMP